MRINAIGSSNYNYNKDIFNIYSKLSSGKRINKAADDAAGLAIAKKLQRQETGLNVSAQNVKDGMGVMNVADGAMSGMTDYLQRIRELALRASNGIYSDSDRETFQTEIDSLKEGIQSLAKNTSFNEQTLLDGSMADMHLATNPEGGGLNISMANTTLEALGIADFDVTSGKFDLSVIDKAMDKISGARSNVGAYTNRLNYTYNVNLGTAENTTRSRSRIEDLDLPVAVSEKKKKDILMQYRNMMQRNIMNQRSSVRLLFQ